MTACVLADDSWKSETFSSIACVPCFTLLLCFITVVISFAVSVYRKLVLQVRKQDLLSLLGFFQAPSKHIVFKSLFTTFLFEASLFEDLCNITVYQRLYCPRRRISRMKCLSSFTSCAVMPHCCCYLQMEGFFYYQDISCAALPTSNSC